MKLFGTRCVAMLVFSAAAHAQECTLGPVAERDAEPSWFFGDALALHGGRLAAGSIFAPSPVMNGLTDGIVRTYVQEDRNWFRESELGYPGTDTSPSFGIAIALDDDLLVVGASLDDVSGSASNEGKAYIYELIAGVWTQTAVLQASDPQIGGRFGEGVATDGTTIVIGATWVPSDTNGSSMQGAAYVFQQQAGLWTEVEKLVASDRDVGARFGATLHVDGTDLLIAAPQRGILNGDKGIGALYRFEDDGSGSFTERELIAAANIDAGDDFGCSFAVADDLLVVGSPDWASGIGNPLGAFFTFRWDGTQWVEEQEEFNPTGLFATGYAQSVATDGSYVAVGAKFLDLAPGDNLGAIFLYRPDMSGVWVLDSILRPDAGAKNGRFASALVSDENLLAASSPFPPAPCDSHRGTVEILTMDGSLCRSLSATRKTHSLSAGGSIRYLLDTGPEHAGEGYFLAGTFSGTNPGITHLGTRVPLNLDVWFQFTVLYANSSFLVRSAGTLDANGRADSTINLPPLMLPSLVGLTLDHAFIVIDGDGSVSDVSNPVPVCLFL